MLNQIYKWFESFVDWIYSLYLTFITWLQEVLVWVYENALYYVWKFLNEISTTIINFITSIPKPDFLVTAESKVCGILSYSLIPNIDLSGPITLIISAYIFRFILRRIPFIN